MKGQIPTQYLLIGGFILICFGLFTMQNIISLDIPLISGHGALILTVGFIMIGYGMFGLIGLGIAVILSLLIVLSSVF